MFKSLITLIM